MVCAARLKRASLVRLFCKSPVHKEKRAPWGVMAGGQGRFLSRGGDKHAFTFEYLHISVKIIQPTKHRAKGDRN